jgi:hypothetical protein
MTILLSLVFRDPKRYHYHDRDDLSQFYQNVDKKRSPALDTILEFELYCIPVGTRHGPGQTICQIGRSTGSVDRKLGWRARYRKLLRSG